MIYLKISLRFRYFTLPSQQASLHIQLCKSSQQQQQQTNQLKFHTIQWKTNKLLIRAFYPLLCFLCLPLPPIDSASNIINQNNIICIFFARAKRAGRIDPLRTRHTQKKKENRKNIFQSITTTISRWGNSRIRAALHWMDWVLPL